MAEEINKANSNPAGSEDDNLEDDDQNEGNNQNNDGGNSGDEGNDGNDSGNNSKTFDQKQVNKMMAREKRQGRNAAFRELGIDPKDSKTIALIKSVLSGSSADNGGNAGNQENDSKVEEANNRARIAEIKADALQLGAKSNYVDDVVTLVMNKIAGEDEPDVSAAIGEVKTKYSVMFNGDDGVDKDKDKNKGAKGTGSSVSNKGKNGSNSEKNNLGARLAAQRKGSNPKKTSFWGK